MSRLPDGWVEKVYAETERRVKRWKREHPASHGFPAHRWNRIWEKVRNEMFGDSVFCERRQKLGKPEEEGGAK